MRRRSKDWRRVPGFLKQLEDRSWVVPSICYCIYSDHLQRCNTHNWWYQIPSDNWGPGWLATFQSRYLKAVNAVDLKSHIYRSQDSKFTWEEISNRSKTPTALIVIANLTDKAMCIIVYLNEDRFQAIQERINGSRFRRACRRLVSKFSSAQETYPPPYTEGASVQQTPRKAIFKRPDSLTLPMYASYRKHVGAQIVEGAIDPENHRGQVFDGGS